MSPSISYTDVLVIGAGPAGLMAANALAEMGIDVKILEKRPVGSPGGHADGIQSRTIEVWHSYDLSHRLLREGNQIHKMVTYAPNQDGDGIEKKNESPNIFVKSVRYPFELIIPTSSIEGIIRSSLEVKGVNIIQPTHPESLEIQQDTDTSRPVKVVIRRSGLTAVDGAGASLSPSPEYETIFTKFLIGADGAQSWVRKSLGIEMEGDAADSSLWGVMDLVPETDFPDIRAKTLVQSPLAGFLGIVPRPGGQVRVYMPFLDSKTDIPPAERIAEAMKKAFFPYKMEINQVLWSASYRVSRRIASMFSKGRLAFIVGDACHTHSPNAGQGANVSMMDAHNLAWKIAYVIRGWASSTLLDTYETERRQVAQELVQFDKELLKTSQPEQLTPDGYRNIIQRQNVFVTGVGIKYTSRLTFSCNQDLAPRMPLGERLPPGPLIRLSDWKPCDIQDLAFFNGLFKIIVFSGQIGNKEKTERLAAFSESLGARLRGKYLDMFDIYIVIRGSKEVVKLDSVPAAFFGLQRVFIDEKEQINPDDTTPTHGMSPNGVVILVRPDGHISLVCDMDPRGSEEVVAALESL